MISIHGLRQRLGLPAAADDPLATTGIGNLDEAGPTDLCFAEDKSQFADQPGRASRPGVQLGATRGDCIRATRRLV